MKATGELVLIKPLPVNKEDEKTESGIIIDAGGTGARENNAHYGRGEVLSVGKLCPDEVKEGMIVLYVLKYMVPVPEEKIVVPVNSVIIITE